MALTDESGGGIPATMLVSPSNMGGGMPYPYPVFGGGQGGGNSGFNDGNGWWIILLFILIAAMGGNWGGNSNGGGMGSGSPIIVNDGNGGSVQRGFDQAAIMSGLNGLQNCCCDMQGVVNNGFANVQQSLCSGFAGVNATVNGAQNALAQQMYTNQIADMERSFAAQTANTQGLTALQSQLANCCCENRAATNDLKFVIAQENCADRAAISDGIRDLLTAQTASTQRILDQMCQDKIDSKNEKIADLERQLTAANLAASQIAQTSQITDSIYNRLSTCPVGTVPVYGEQPIFRCNNNNGCGCGGNF